MKKLLGVLIACTIAWPAAAQDQMKIMVGFAAGGTSFSAMAPGECEAGFYCSTKARRIWSAIGLNRCISSAVSSRTSPSLSVKDLRIEPLLSSVRSTKTDDPARIITKAVTNRVESSGHRNQSETSFLAIVAPLIEPDMRGAPIQFRSQFERQSALFSVPRALRRIEFNLHG